jgi:glycosyltransferase involved in cell wall biosynthesis
LLTILFWHMPQVSMKPDISIVIIANNAAHTLNKCLESAVKISDDIILVLDVNSSDGSMEIAEKYRVKVVRSEWLGYGPTKNLGNLHASHDWILSLDADEYLDDRFVKELESLTLRDNCVYQINRLTYVGDVPIRYSGWHPDWNDRIFNKKHIRWDEKPVHESLIIPEHFNRLKIKGMMHHLSVRSFEELDDRLDRYARLRAEEWRQNPKKLSLFYRLTRPAFRFFRDFIIRLGFLDGAHGWRVAKAEYTMIRKQYAYFDLLSEKEKEL